MYLNPWRKRKLQIMVDGGFEHCAKGQAEYFQSHRNPTTSLLPGNRLSFAQKASPLQQAVDECLSQEKTQRAAARDHSVNRFSLGEACKRAPCVDANARWLQLVRSHSR